jgi:transposase
LHHERGGIRRRLAGERIPLDNIENFWSQARRHLGRYNGVPRQHLPLFLKECEWRFNFGSPGKLRAILESWARRSDRRR